MLVLINEIKSIKGGICKKTIDLIESSVSVILLLVNCVKSFFQRINLIQIERVYGETLG